MPTNRLSLLIIGLSISLPSIASTTTDASSPLPSIREASLSGDHDRALLLASRALAINPRGPNAEALWYLIGSQNRQLKRHNLASEAMTRARRYRGVFREAATYYEAEQDRLRGKPRVAIKECDAYKTTYPEGRHLSDCQRTTAMAYADLGAIERARTQATEYDANSPNKIGDRVEIRLASTVYKSRPKEAIRIATSLFLNHTTLGVGADARQLLVQWGVPLPDSTSDRIRRIASLRDSGLRDESIDLYAQLAATIPEDDLINRGYLASQSRFTGWRNRDWSRLEADYRDSYTDNPSSKDAWSLYRVYFRSGQYSAATDWATEALKRHSGTRNWRRNESDFGHTMMLHGAYGQAVIQFDQAASRGGVSGRSAEFFAAFSRFQMGDYNDARVRFTAIIDGPKGVNQGARYWRSKTLLAIGEPLLAAQDESWLHQNAPDDWYTQLLVSQHISAAHRDGRWVLPTIATTKVTPLLAFTTSTYALAIPRGSRVARGEPSDADVMGLAWPRTTNRKMPVSAADTPWLGTTSLLRPPPQYWQEPLFDRPSLLANVNTLIADLGDDWPEIAEIAALANIGLSDQSGAQMASFWAIYKRALRSRGDPRHKAARALYKRNADVLSLMLMAYDNHNLAKQWANAARRSNDEASTRYANMVANPLAHASIVWRASAGHHIDPMLVTALMRRESLFNPLAVSKVGARGAMQIMPRTGGLIARHLTDASFRVSDLENPQIAIPYAVTYLSLLMDRFDGVFPLAVAAYNAGPHNVGNWLNAAPDDMTLDVFIEHIPYKETRRYVKGVTSSYATIAKIYGQDNATIGLPHTLPADNRAVVNF